MMRNATGPAMCRTREPPSAAFGSPVPARNADLPNPTAHVLRHSAITEAIEMAVVMGLSFDKVRDSSAGCTLDARHDCVG